jgi:hypothetical protein
VSLKREKPQISKRISAGDAATLDLAQRLTRVSQAKKPRISNRVAGGGAATLDPATLLAPVSRHISEALWLVESKSTPPEQRDVAILLILSAFRKCSWVMRRFVVDVEMADVLQQFIEQTRFNCALLQNSHKINRKRVKEIAREMPEFPILQSAGSQLREKARLFLRSIDLGGNLPGGRGSTRWTNTVFMWAAKLITQHLQALLKIIPVWLNHPDATCRLDKNQLEPAYKNALNFFESINFDISVHQMTLQNWRRLWNIISTLIVDDRSSPDLSSDADLWRVCSWTDFYENDDLRNGIKATSQRCSEANLRTHIRDKIKKKIEAELGITKLKKRDQFRQ